MRGSSVSSVPVLCHVLECSFLIYRQLTESSVLPDLCCGSIFQVSQQGQKG